MDNKIVGKFIAECRRVKGLTQQQLADQVNLSNKTISKWESGAGSPDIGNLTSLADALGVTVDELLRGALVECKDLPAIEQNNPESYERESVPARKKERMVMILAASIGAILGIMAYHNGWLG